MKKTSFQLVYTLLISSLMAGLFSCSNSRVYKNYTYSPRENAPDIGGSINSSTAEMPQASVNQPNQIQSKAHEEFAPISPETDLITPEIQEKADLVRKAFNEELNSMEESGEIASNRELIKKVTNKLTETGQINPFNKKQEKELNRLALKMDKKLQKQGNGIDWRHNTNLELFFMIMAIAGLVLGIVGLSWGWFILIVFGGLWLYWKLVQDKK